MEGAFAAFTAFLVAALPLAVGVTKVVDTARNLFDPDATRVPKVTWNLVALAAGVGLCLGWQFNLFVPLVAAVPALKDSGLAGGVAGQVLTGIAVGAMAGFWHEKLDQWSSTAKLNKATAAATQPAARVG